MKIKNKIMIVCIIFMLLIYLFPLTSNARQYSLSGTDISIYFDDTEWYVFTRDNLLNNTELDELNISYDYLNNFMITNSVYLDAILFLSDSSDDYIESFVRINKIDEVNTLENVSREDLLKLAKGIANTANASDYDIYTNDYNFVELNYNSQGLFLNEYYTIINGYTYVITFQKPSSFTNYDYIDIKNIIDSIDFYIDPNLKNNDSQSTLFDWEEIGEEALIGGLVAIIFSIGSYIFNKDKDKNNSIKEKKYNNKETSSIWKTIGIIVLSFISSEMILMLILDDSIEGTAALLLTCVVTIPFYYLYSFIFRKKEIKKSENNENKIVWIKCKVCGKTIPYNNNETCEECNKKILERLELKKNVNKDIAPIKTTNKNEIAPVKNTSRASHICLSYENEKYDKKGDFDIRSEDVMLVKKEATIYCTNCGKEVDETWKHCKYCGKEIK